jgi:hypothetical protein
MNHGVVLFQGNGTPESRIWEIAMSRGEFIAVYTRKGVGWAGDGGLSELWSSAFVQAMDDSWTSPGGPNLAEHFTDYARYEPSYGDQFVRMCQGCTSYGAPTVVLPASASDEEAMRLLNALHSIETSAWRRLHERFYVVPRQNLRRAKKTGIRLSDLVGTFKLNERWSYLLGFFRSGDDVVVFLSNDELDIAGLFDPASAGSPPIRQADWLYEYSVIEKW